MVVSRRSLAEGSRGNRSIFVRWSEADNSYLMKCVRKANDRRLTTNGALVHVAVAAGFFAGTGGPLKVGNESFEIIDEQSKTFGLGTQ